MRFACCRNEAGAAATTTPACSSRRRHSFFSSRPTKRVAFSALASASRPRGSMMMSSEHQGRHRRLSHHHHHHHHHRRFQNRTTPRAAKTTSSSGAAEVGEKELKTTKSSSDISNIFDDASVRQETTFWGKLSAAYRIFFPPSEADTAREEAKKRLRMILVADRCTMSDQSMEEMKRKIIDVVEQYVEVDEDVPVDVKVKDDVEFGTVYGITVPVSKVKAEYDAENEAYMIGAQFVYDDETWEELQKETEGEEKEEA